MTNRFSKIFMDSDGDIPDVIAGLMTGVKGMRVYIGPTDLISDLPVVVDFAHHQLHEGELHQYTYGPAALANGATIDLRIVVGNLEPTTRTPHFAVELDATAETWLYLYETPTTSANGTQQTVYNRNRNSANAPGTTLWLSPTVSAVGTPLSSWIVGAGNKTGGNGRDSIEWVLKPNTVYLVRMTAKATGDNVCLRAMWYEDLGV